MPQQFDFPGRRTVPQIKLSPKMVYAVIGVLFGLWLISGIYQVEPDEQGVILRFGKLQEVVGPGLHYHLPNPIEVKIVRSVTQVYRQEIGFRTISPGPPARYVKKEVESLMLTGDENIIDVEMVVQFRVTDIVKSLFNVRGLGVYIGGAEGLVHQACEAALRQVIGRHEIDEALTEGKLLIQNEIQEKLQELFDRYDCGLVVESVQLQSVAPPAAVDAAFKDVASAKEDRERKVNEALGYQNDVIPRARGEAEKMLREADGYKVERIRTSLGDTDRFKRIYTEYLNAPDITETRLYIETMERVLPKVQKYIVDGKNSGLLNILNLDKKGQ